jgi:uncharacterized repeat protein (TIGR03803 family)
LDSGTVFKINTDGTGFTILRSFTTVPFNFPSNSDGALPNGGLALSGNSIYGTTWVGGSSGNGTVFAVQTDGTGFRTLYSFTVLSEPPIDAGTNTDGANPDPGRLVLSSNTLYGITAYGGIGGNGTIFSISLPPQLTISSVSGSAVLTWPTNFTGFTLQSTTKLASPAWTTNLPAPVVANGQYTVTNPISGTQQFFRLSQ